MLHLHDVNVTITPSSLFEVYENKYILIKDTLMVYQLDTRLIDLLTGELRGKVNGINVCHIPIECGLQAYRDACDTLIKYIIFHQQNNIVDNNLIFFNEQSEFHEVAKEMCEINQRKITKMGYALFPLVDKACVNRGLKGYKFSTALPNDSNRSVVSDPAVYTHETVYDLMPVGVDCTKEPYASDGSIYELTPEARVSIGTEDWEETKMQYRSIWIKETYSITLHRFFSQIMGSLASSVEEPSGSIIIEHKVRPDEYMVISD